jgi:hypothetical protein
MVEKQQALAMRIGTSLGAIALAMVVAAGCALPGRRGNYCDG